MLSFYSTSSLSLFFILFLFIPSFHSSLIYSFLFLSLSFPFPSCFLLYLIALQIFFLTSSFLPPSFTFQPLIFTNTFSSFSLSPLPSFTHGSTTYLSPFFLPLSCSLLTSKQLLQTTILPVFLLSFHPLFLQPHVKQFLHVKLLHSCRAPTTGHAPHRCITVILSCFPNV